MPKVLLKINPIFISIALLAFISCTTSDKRDGDWLYYIENENNVSITGYKGTDTDLIIPKEIRGMTVIDISLCALEGGYWDNNDELIIGHQLTSVIIPESVITISQYAFAENLIITVVIPDKVEWIGVYAFASNKLTSVIIGSNVNSIDYGAFANNEISELIIPDSVTSINNLAFAYNKITDIIIPKNVTRLGETAFAGNQLNSITIGENVDIENDIFWQWEEQTNGNFGAFKKFYKILGKEAGTYIYDDGNWSFDDLHYDSKTGILFRLKY